MTSHNAIKRAAWILCVAAAVGAGALAIHHQEAAIADSQTANGSAPSDAQALLDEFAALRLPPLDQSKQHDPQYATAYIKAQNEVLSRRAELAKSFNEKYPRNPKALDLMRERWLALFALDQTATANQEMDTALANHPSAMQRADILYVRAVAPILTQNPIDPTRIEEFIRAAPGDVRGARLLLAMADDEQDAAKKSAMYQRIVQDYGNSPEAGEAHLQRWLNMAHSAQTAGAAAKEIDQDLAAHPDAPEKIDLYYLRAYAKIMAFDSSASAAIDAFAAAAPIDSRIADLQVEQAKRESDPIRQVTMLNQVIKEYPDSAPGQEAANFVKQIPLLGKPFDLTFTDAISGKRISLQNDLKGKVVVVDFWATWCPECVREMPRNKELYDQYKDKGVAFIGVSLDQPQGEGGLVALKEFVAKNHIPWPQYYQGNGWTSEFSSKWNIFDLPSVFVVDADGKLASVTAQGQLDTLLPQLLAKK